MSTQLAIAPETASPTAETIPEARAIAPVPSEPSTAQAVLPAPPAAIVPAGSDQTLGIISFALAVASIVTPSFVLLSIAALVVGIVALVRRPSSKAFALTGVIISGVMLLGGLLLVLGFGVLFGIAAIAAA